MRRILCLAVCFTSVFAQIGGPFDLVLRKMAECEDRGSRDLVFDLRSRPVNRTTLFVDGNVVLPYGMSDTVKFFVTVGKPPDPGKSWEKTQKTLEKNFGGMCTAIRLYAPHLAQQIFKIFRYPGTQCPRKGNYTIHNNLVFSLSGIPVFVYGKYRVNIDTMSANNMKLGCLYVIGETVPKKSWKKNKGK